MTQARVVGMAPYVKAWALLRDVRAQRLGWTVHDALAHPTVGKVVRAIACDLARGMRPLEGGGK